MAYKEGKHNFLKYYRVIKKFMKIKYKLTEDRLDILLFCYSEPPFTRSKVKDFESLLVWDKRRWDGLLRDGWIQPFGNSSRPKLYCLSLKGNMFVERFYSYLEGKEIPMSPNINPAFKRNVSYSDKVFRDMVKTMNKYIYINNRKRDEYGHFPKDSEWLNLDGVYD